MSTRGLIRIFEDEQEICRIYNHWDSYPSGLGAKLVDFCARKEIVNGIRGNADMARIANGMGCFAAQLVAELKTRPGGLSLLPTGEDTDCGQCYEYRIHGRFIQWPESGLVRNYAVLTAYSVTSGGLRQLERPDADDEDEP